MKHVHYIHHKHRVTVGIAATNAHPVEFILGNALPASAGALLLGKNIHFWTFVMYITW